MKNGFLCMYIAMYLERIQLFFVANGIAKNKQVATLLLAVGPKTYIHSSKRFVNPNGHRTRQLLNCQPH